MTLRTPVKIVLVASALAVLGACAYAPPADQGPSKTAATDTQQWMDRIKVAPAPDEIVLATHAAGLSANQSAALDGLMGRWLQTEARELVVTAPNAAGAMAAQIRERLITLGAPAARVRVAGFDPTGPEDAVIRVGFVRHVAEPIKCGQRWGNLSATRNNEAHDNFGCAIAANLAAQVANPEDLVRPRDTTPPDAARRDTVFGKYRKGEITSSARDEQASGALSKAIK